MFQGYRVVCVTPAGRRRYMKLLVPQILASPIVDRYDVCVNTEDAGDLAFLRRLPELDPARPERVRLVAQPDNLAPDWGAIAGFHRLALDEDTIYIRLDDDVVWLEPGFFETLLTFRIANPRYFLVMPLIINNAVCTHLLWTLGKITSSRFVGAACMDPVGWRDPKFAIKLHGLFLDLLGRGEAARLHCGAHEIAMNRFSINAICWFGRDFASFGGLVGDAEEEELSNLIPTRLGRSNCFCTDTIAAHFAFYVQRRALDRTDILGAYARQLAGRAELRPLLDAAAELCAAVDVDHPPMPAVKAPRRSWRTKLWNRWFPPPPAPRQPVELGLGPSF
ncbi:MAG TPA: hypothetical protein VGF43_10010 [Dongiaceae bacterium]|jgi:hypothetical protein